MWSRWRTHIALWEIPGVVSNKLAFCACLEGSPLCPSIVIYPSYLLGCFRIKKLLTRLIYPYWLTNVWLFMVNFMYQFNCFLQKFCCLFTCFLDIPPCLRILIYSESSVTSSLSLSIYSHIYLFGAHTVKRSCDLTPVGPFALYYHLPLLVLLHLPP